MSLVVTVALVVLVAALLLGLTYNAFRRGLIGRPVALILAAVVVLAGGATFFYPSALIVEQQLGS